MVVPVIERCEMDAALQLAKADHPTLPPLRLGVTLPTLRFYISPARLHRVMRILHAALPSASPLFLDAASSGALLTPRLLRRNQAEFSPQLKAPGTILLQALLLMWKGLQRCRCGGRTQTGRARCRCWCGAASAMPQRSGSAGMRCCSAAA